MKTLITISIGILTMSLIPIQSSAQVNEKFYRVTDDGKFQFTYWQYSEGPKGGVHLVTPRTLYLETKRQGLLPEYLSYATFLELSNEQKQAILEFSQQDVIAAMKGIPGNTIKESVSVMVMQEPVHNAITVTEAISEKESEKSYEEELSQDADRMEPEQKEEIPWIVRTITQPGVAHDLPDDDAASISISPAEQPAESKEIPWIVRAIIMHDHPLDIEELESGNAPAISIEEANKRVRICTLLNELLAYQDDEIQKEYGKVFPGMDGKLYGTSDAELDEILTELLHMKDDFSADLNPELDKIFSELEALASGR